MPLVLELRQHFDDASKEDIARDQQKVEYQDGRKQTIEDCTGSRKERARQAEIAVNLNDRTRSSGVRDLFGLLNDLLQRFDWGL